MIRSRSGSRQEAETLVYNSNRRHQIVLNIELKRLEMEKRMLQRYFYFENALIKARQLKLRERQKELGIHLRPKTTPERLREKRASLFITSVSMDKPRGPRLPPVLERGHSFAGVTSSSKKQEVARFGDTAHGAALYMDNKRDPGKKLRLLDRRINRGKLHLGNSAIIEETGKLEKDRQSRARMRREREDGKLEETVDTNRLSTGKEVEQRLVGNSKQKECRFTDALRFTANRQVQEAKVSGTQNYSSFAKETSGRVDALDVGKNETRQVKQQGSKAANSDKISEVVSGVSKCAENLTATTRNKRENTMNDTTVEDVWDFSRNSSHAHKTKTDTKKAQGGLHRPVSTQGNYGSTKTEDKANRVDSIVVRAHSAGVR